MERTKYVVGPKKRKSSLKGADLLEDNLNPPKKHKSVDCASIYDKTLQLNQNDCVDKTIKKVKKHKFHMDEESLCESIKKSKECIEENVELPLMKIKKKKRKSKEIDYIEELVKEDDRVEDNDVKSFNTIEIVIGSEDKESKTKNKKKKSKKGIEELMIVEENVEGTFETSEIVIGSKEKEIKTKKKKKKSKQCIEELIQDYVEKNVGGTFDTSEIVIGSEENEFKKKKKKKSKNKDNIEELTKDGLDESIEEPLKTIEIVIASENQSKKKKKNKSTMDEMIANNSQIEASDSAFEESPAKKSKKKKKAKYFEDTLIEKNTSINKSQNCSKLVFETDSEYSSQRLSSDEFQINALFNHSPKKIKEEPKSESESPAKKVLKIKSPKKHKRLSVSENSDIFPLNSTHIEDKSSNHLTSTQMHADAIKIEVNTPKKINKKIAKDIDESFTNKSITKSHVKTKEDSPKKSNKKIVNENDETSDYSPNKSNKKGNDFDIKSNENSTKKFNIKIAEECDETPEFSPNKSNLKGNDFNIKSNENSTKKFNKKIAEENDETPENSPNKSITNEYTPKKIHKKCVKESDETPENSPNKSDEKSNKIHEKVEKTTHKKIKNNAIDENRIEADSTNKSSKKSMKNSLIEKHKSKKPQKNVHAIEENGSNENVESFTDFHMQIETKSPTSDDEIDEMIRLHNDNQDSSDEEDQANLKYLRDQTKEVNVSISDESRQALENICVEIDFDVPMIHLIETRMSSCPTKEQNDQIKALQIDIKKGNYTKQEDALIKDNWAYFCKKHSLDVNCPELFTQFVHEGMRRKCPVLNKEDRIKFVQTLAKGLNNRLLASVYKRFQTLFKKLKKGHFTKQEDDIIMEQMGMPLKSQFCNLSKILNRNRLGIEKHYRQLCEAAKFTKSTIYHEDKEQLVVLLLEELNLSSVKKLRNREISIETWRKIAEKMNIKPNKLSHIWSSELHMRLFVKESDLEGNRRKLLQALYDLDTDDFRAVSWANLVPQFPGYTSWGLYKLFKNMSFFVPPEQRKKLKESIIFLNDLNKIGTSKQIEKLKFENGILRNN